MSMMPCGIDGFFEADKKQAILDGTGIYNYPNITPVWLILQEGLVQIVSSNLTRHSNTNEAGG